MNSNNLTILQPLHFSASANATTSEENNISTICSSNSSSSSSNNKNLVFDISCILCDKIFKFNIEKDIYLAHLYLKHRLVIGDVDDIAILDEYLIYWRKEFHNESIEEFCTTMIMDQLPDGTPSKNEKYYLLSDILPKDFALRKKLHTKRLNNVLTQHQFERTDETFKRECLYCRDVIQPTRNNFVQHLFDKHFLQLGKSENIVFIDELVDCVQNKLDNLCCLFCEKIFKDRSTLKEHMRKKGHKRINPDNKKYDKYFLINYRHEKSPPQQKYEHHQWRQPNLHLINKKNYNNKNKSIKKTKTNTTATATTATTATDDDSLKSTDKVFQTDNSDSDWSDWEGEKQRLICLFCSMSDTDFNLLKKHIKTEHDIDFDEMICNLNFYEKIKIVNYIRRQMHILCCINCTKKFATTIELQEHYMAEKHHLKINDRKLWNQPEYFFPTYEDDVFLCYLEDNNESVDNSIVVLPEDQNLSINLAVEALSKENHSNFDI